MRVLRVFVLFADAKRGEWAPAYTIEEIYLLLSCRELCESACWRLQLLGQQRNTAVWWAQMEQLYMVHDFSHLWILLGAFVRALSEDVRRFNWCDKCKLVILQNERCAKCTESLPPWVTWRSAETGTRKRWLREFLGRLHMMRWVHRKTLEQLAFMLAVEPEDGSWHIVMRLNSV